MRPAAAVPMVIPPGFVAMAAHRQQNAAANNVLPRHLAPNVPSNFHHANFSAPGNPGFVGLHMAQYAHTANMNLQQPLWFASAAAAEAADNARAAAGVDNDSDDSAVDSDDSDFAYGYVDPPVRHRQPAVNEARNSSLNANTVTSFSQAAKHFT